MTHYSTDWWALLGKFAWQYVPNNKFYEKIPNSVASLCPLCSTKDCGFWNLNLPTGGTANGMPRKAYTGVWLSLAWTTLPFTDERRDRDTTGSIFYKTKSIEEYIQQCSQPFDMHKSWKQKESVGCAFAHCYTLDDLECPWTMTCVVSPKMWMWFRQWNMSSCICVYLIWQKK